MPLNDHVLLLQLERAHEALSDEVGELSVGEQYADVDHSHDEYARDWEINDLQKEHSELASHVDDVAEKLDGLDAWSETAVDDLQDYDKRIVSLREQLLELTGICIELAEKVEALQAENTWLIATLRNTGHRV